MSLHAEQQRQRIRSSATHTNWLQCLENNCTEAWISQLCKAYILTLVCFNFQKWNQTTIVADLQGRWGPTYFNPWSLYHARRNFPNILVGLLRARDHPAVTHVADLSAPGLRAAKHNRHASACRIWVRIPRPSSTSKTIQISCFPRPQHVQRLYKIQRAMRFSWNCRPCVSAVNFFSSRALKNISNWFL